MNAKSPSRPSSDLPSVSSLAKSASRQKPAGPGDAAGPFPRRQIEIIGAAIGCGARDPRCEYGPDALRDWGLDARLRELADAGDRASGSSATWRDQIYPHYGSNKTEPQTIVPEFSLRLMRSVAAARGRGAFPLVVGGDHSCGIGTWSGVHQDLASQGALGLIWIDAHMDSHTPDTTPTGALHGMPLATLLGFGDPRLTGLGGIQAKLAARHVCLVGVRSFEPGEAELIARLGVRVFFADEVFSRGMNTVLADALSIVQSGTAGFGVSIDLDAVDPEDAPGVGSPVSGGLRGNDLTGALRVLAPNPRLLGLEIAEYNPFLDPRGATRELVLRLAGAALLPPVTAEGRATSKLAA